jgi:chemotaxis protein methyltransferase CheR
MQAGNTSLLRALGPDLHLTQDEFDRIRELVREHTGIALAEGKRQLVYGRLSRRLRALKLTTFSQYIEILERGETSELEEFINAVTTNLTSFFREPHHFEFLGQELLPALVKREGSRRRIRIWCCAASTGEEPYSIAMVVRETQALQSGWDVKVLATDLDSNVLGHGKWGVYARDRFEAVSPRRIARFFEAVSGEDRLSARDELRDLITFKQLNLMHEWPMKGPFDAIFCRNVIIYFDKETQRALFERMAALQRPGDFLFLGHSESLYRVSDRYELIGRTIYRRLKD